MDANEIVQALRTCNKPRGHRCSECPVFSRYEHSICKATVDRQAADLIGSLQVENEKLDNEADSWMKLEAESQRRERAAVEVVRCKECRWKDTALCRASKSIKYDLRREKHTYKTFMEPDGFCSIGERGPQEAEKGEKR